MRRKIKDIKGQLPLPFGQKPKKGELRKLSSLAERRQTKETAYRLARQAYALQGKICYS